MKHICKRLTAWLLVFTMMVAFVPAVGIANAVDLDTLCSLTINPGGTDFGDDYAKSGVVVDVYQVAVAEAISGYDGYAYAAQPAYSDLEFNGAQTIDDWAILAQQAISIALNTGAGRVAENAAVKQPIEQLGAGLYLVVPHGADMIPEHYVTTVTDGKGNESIATIANSDFHTYRFAPALVALPTKEADSNGSITAANPGDWIYYATVTLKPQQTPRLVSLKIIKQLINYDEIGGPATFDFQIVAMLDEKKVCDKIVSLTFEAAGEQYCIVDDIPVGAEVTVTELNTNASYKLVEGWASSQTITLQLDTEFNEVKFVNEFTGTTVKSGRIINRFEYVVGNDSKKPIGWTWQTPRS